MNGVVVSPPFAVCVNTAAGISVRYSGEGILLLNMPGDSPIETYANDTDPTAPQTYTVSPSAIFFEDTNGFLVNSAIPTTQKTITDGTHTYTYPSGSTLSGSGSGAILEGHVSDMLPAGFVVVAADTFIPISALPPPDANGYIYLSFSFIVCGTGSANVEVINCYNPGTGATCNQCFPVGASQTFTVSDAGELQFCFNDYNVFGFTGNTGSFIVTVDNLTTSASNSCIVYGSNNGYVDCCPVDAGDTVRVSAEGLITVFSTAGTSGGGSGTIACSFDPNGNTVDSGCYPVHSCGGCFGNAEAELDGTIWRDATCDGVTSGPGTISDEPGTFALWTSGSSVGSVPASDLPFAVGDFVCVIHAIDQSVLGSLFAWDVAVSMRCIGGVWTPMFCVIVNGCGATSIQYSSVGTGDVTGTIGCSGGTVSIVGTDIYSDQVALTLTVSPPPPTIPTCSTATPWSLVGQLYCTVTNCIQLGTDYTFTADFNGTLKLLYNNAPDQFVDGSGSFDVMVFEGASAYPVTVPNYSFEAPSVPNSYQANPSGADWTFTGNCGVTGGGSPFVFDPTPLDGTQAAYIQAGATISQTISGFNPGTTYTIVFYTTKQPDQPQVDFFVQIDGVPIFTPIVPTATWQEYRVNFIASATSHTLSFNASPGSTQTSYIDDVRIYGGTLIWSGSVQGNDSSGTIGPYVTGGTQYTVVASGYAGYLPGYYTNPDGDIMASGSGSGSGSGSFVGYCSAQIFGSLVGILGPGEPPNPGCPSIYVVTIQQTATSATTYTLINTGLNVWSATVDGVTVTLSPDPLDGDSFILTDSEYPTAYWVVPILGGCPNPNTATWIKEGPPNYPIIIPGGGAADCTVPIPTTLYISASYQYMALPTATVLATILVNAAPPALGGGVPGPYVIDLTYTDSSLFGVYAGMSCSDGVWTINSDVTSENYGGFGTGTVVIVPTVVNGAMVFTVSLTTSNGAGGTGTTIISTSPLI